MELNRILGKWQFIYWCDRIHFRDWGITVGLINFFKLPEMGTRIRKRHHRGIGISLRIHPPIFTYRRRYFQVLGIQQMVTYPVWISFKYMFHMEVW